MGKISYGPRMYYSVLWSSHKIGWMEGILGQPLPKYMLSHNIRLQEVFEIIANETAKVLHMLARQQTKMQCYLLKFIGFRLFTYLWRSCGKFNLSYSCLEIDDARWNEGSCSYPTQTWNGWNPDSLFRGWSSTFGWFKSFVNALLSNEGLVGACTWNLSLERWK